MEEDIIDVLHRIAFDIEDEKLEKLTAQHEVTGAILSKPNQSVEIDRNGIAAITEEVRITSRKRWNS